MRMKSTPVALAELPDVMTVTEAAEFLRLGRNSIYEAIRRGEVPTVRIGRRILVPKVGLENLLATRSPEG
jgi:excisionase family DNA binding protein